MSNFADLSEIISFLEQNKKEFILILITAIVTFILTKALPTVLSYIGKLGGYIKALVTGRRKHYKFEKRYLKWLINEHKYLAIIPSQVLNPEHMPRQPELEQIYIRLHLIRGDNSSTEYSLSNLLTKGSKTVILGDPGAGKTTLLKYLCLTYSQLNLLSIFSYSKRKCFKERIKSKHTLVPIFLPLNKFNTLHENSNNVDPTSILDFFQKFLPEPLHAICPSDYFQKLLASGRCIILLDGFDEISTYSFRLKVAQTVGSLANASHSDTVWIVTSRIVGYKAQLQQYNFQVTIVKPLTPRQVNGFIYNWYKRKLEMMAYPDDETEYQTYVHTQRAKHLIETFQSNPGLSSLAVNPMLLSLIALLHSVQLELPENRAILYRDCVELLSDRWDWFRGIQNENDLRITTNQKISILTTVASEMHSNRMREIKRSELENMIMVELNKIVDIPGLSISHLIDELEERSGLLISRGLTETGEKIMAFSHLTFQEYLTAVSLLHEPGVNSKKIVTGQAIL